MQEQYQGYCSIWYFPLFTSENGYKVIDENVENMFTALRCVISIEMILWAKDNHS